MGRCSLPGCDEWINSACETYCCELHRTYHKLDLAKNRIAFLETAIEKFSDGLKHYDSETITGLDQLRAALRREVECDVSKET